MILKDLNSAWAKALVSFLNQFSFLLANLILFLVFQHFISGSFVVFLVSTILSFLIIGRLYDYKLFFWWLITLSLFIFGNLGYIQVGLAIWLVCSLVAFIFFARKKYNPDETKALKPMVAIKFLVVLPKIVFFSTAHIIFPLLLIWVSVVGVSYLVGVITVSSFPILGGILGILGLLSGFYQFYIDRYDEKIQKKIAHYFTTMIIPRDKIGIKEYKKFLEGKSKYKSVRSNLDTFGTGMLKYLANIRHFQNAQSPVFLSLVPGQDEIAYFVYLEQESQNNKTLNKQLKESYVEFFEEKKEEVLKELQSKDLSEVKWVLLGNINILEEAQASIISTDFQASDDPETYAEFVKKLYIEVFNEVLDDIIFK